MTQVVPLRAVVVGDVVVDYVIDLSDTKLNKLSDLNHRFENKVTQLVGGSARNFAAAANKVGFSTHLISRVGSHSQKPTTPDSDGQYIIDSLKQEKITPLMSLDAKISTGKVVITYLQNDQRFMISDRGASVNFSKKDVDASTLNIIKQSHLIYVDGYNSLKYPLKATAKYLMKSAARRNIPVAYDLVPHKIYRIMTFAQLKRYTKFVTILSTELNTARRFVGLSPRTKPPSSSSILNTLKPFTSLYQAVFIRIDQECIVISNNQIIYRTQTNYHSGIGISKRGYFDAAFAKFLHLYLSKNMSI